MSCPTCGRTGRCDDCCCVSPDHVNMGRGRLCRLCKHSCGQRKAEVNVR